MHRTSGKYHVAVFIDGSKDLNIYVLVVHFPLSAKPATQQPLEDRCTFGARSRTWRPAARSTSPPQSVERARSCTVTFSCSRVKQVWTDPPKCSRNITLKSIYFSGPEFKCHRHLFLVRVTYYVLERSEMTLT